MVLSIEKHKLTWSLTNLSANKTEDEHSDTDMQILKANCK